MRSSQKHHVHTFFMQRLPAQRLQRMTAIAADVRIHLVKLRRLAMVGLARE